VRLKFGLWGDQKRLAATSPRCRIILGIGIGGDYPVSATIMSEYSGKESRGRMVGLVFAMQGAGLLIGPLLASVFLAGGVSDNLTWRLLLGLGAIPGLAVFYLRRQIHETPRFAMAGGAADDAQAAIAAATGEGRGGGSGAPLVSAARESKARQSQGVADGFFKLFRNRRLAIWLLGTAGGWMLLDFCYYGNTISAPEILKLINPHASLLENTLLQLAIFAAFAVPGYIVAILLLDKTGRRGIQILGFGMMALMFLIIGLIPAIARHVLPFMLLYGVSYFFTEFGPNTTTFIYPAELFPVDVRTTGHGISAGAGKAGRVRGRLPVPRLPGRDAGAEPRHAHRRDRGGRRHAADDPDAARAQGPEPGADRGEGLRAGDREAARASAARDLRVRIG
jgi:PHS family inorganic phosphate transporter-like MFS transporter